MTLGCLSRRSGRDGARGDDAALSPRTSACPLFVAAASCGGASGPAPAQRRGERSVVLVRCPANPTAFDRRCIPAEDPPRVSRRSWRGAVGLRREDEGLQAERERPQRRATPAARNARPRSASSCHSMKGPTTQLPMKRTQNKPTARLMRAAKAVKPWPAVLRITDQARSHRSLRAR